MYTVFQESKHHKKATIRYAGRAPSASVASGLKGTHTREEGDFVNFALGIEK